MKRKVGIGIQDFSTIRENNCFYVDKTSFIKEWWESKDVATLITRPRRFGKTLNMSMLEKFFSVNYAGRSDLFEGLSIWEEEEYRNLQGTYPVINLSFANVKEVTFENASYRIRQILMEQYTIHYFLKDKNILSTDEREHFKQMLNEMREEDVPMALYHLSHYLYRYYGKKVIILLDEYDTPMQEAYANGYLDELVTLIGSFFDSTFRINPWMEQGIMIGITKIDCKSMFSELDHIQIITYLSDQYATSFGFTEEEVFVALDKFDLRDEKEKVKFWYDGFIFGNCQNIYNPWCISNFLDKKRYQLYWADTSTNGLVGKLIREGNRKIKISFEKLLKGEHIWSRMNEQMLYIPLDDNEEAIWELLVVSGYMKIISCNSIVVDNKLEIVYKLAFTNFEVKSMFRNIVRSWFGYARGDYEDFVKAMFTGDIEEMNAYLNRVVLRTFGLFNAGKDIVGDESERFYYSLVLAFMVDLGDQYIIIPNHESGLGRYNVILEPRNKEDNALILEFKTYDEEKEEGLKDTVQAALAQIEERQYAENLIVKGIPTEKIYKYGFAFDGMKVRIG